MRRHELTDSQCALIEGMLQGRVSDAGRTAEDNRLFVNVLFWIAKTGVPWRGLSEHFGKWNSVYQRFRRWCKKGVWQQIGQELGIEEELEILMLDSTIVRVHQHGAGAKPSMMAAA